VIAAAQDKAAFAAHVARHSQTPAEREAAEAAAAAEEAADGVADAARPFRRAAAEVLEAERQARLAKAAADEAAVMGTDDDVAALLGRLAEGRAARGGPKPYRLDLPR